MPEKERIKQNLFNVYNVMRDEEKGSVFKPTY
jgi:hypothetical protein